MFVVVNINVYKEIYNGLEGEKKWGKRCLMQYRITMRPFSIKENLAVLFCLLNGQENNNNNNNGIIFTAKLILVPGPRD